MPSVVSQVWFRRTQVKKVVECIAKHLPERACYVMPERKSWVIVHDYDSWRLAGTPEEFRAVESLCAVVCARLKCRAFAFSIREPTGLSGWVFDEDGRMVVDLTSSDEQRAVEVLTAMSQRAGCKQEHVRLAVAGVGREAPDTIIRSLTWLFGLSTFHSVEFPYIVLHARTPKRPSSRVPKPARNTVEYFIERIRYVGPTELGPQGDQLPGDLPEDVVRDALSPYPRNVQEMQDMTDAQVMEVLERHAAGPMRRVAAAELLRVCWFVLPSESRTAAALRAMAHEAIDSEVEEFLARRQGEGHGP